MSRMANLKPIRNDFSLQKRILSVFSIYKPLITCCEWISEKRSKLRVTPALKWVFEVS